jgi:hypothetical protein
MSRNPHFGHHGWRDNHGDTAPRKRPRRPIPVPQPRRREKVCPTCGVEVEFDTDWRGRTVVVEKGRDHLCNPDRALLHMIRRPGTEILDMLRRVVTERRVYGSTV